MINFGTHIFDPGGCRADVYYNYSNVHVCERTGVCLGQPEYNPPIEDDEEALEGSGNLDSDSNPEMPPKSPSEEKKRDRFSHEEARLGAEKSVVCLAAVMINCLVYVLMF